MTELLMERFEDDDEAFKASLEIEGEEIFSIKIDYEKGKWEFNVPEEDIVLKGNFEEDGDVTTIEVTKMSVYNVDYSEYVKLKVIINTDDPMTVASDEEITNLFSMSREDLLDLFSGFGVNGDTEYFPTEDDYDDYFGGFEVEDYFDEDYLEDYLDIYY